MTSSFRTRLTVRWTIALGIVLGLAKPYRTIEEIAA